MELYRVYSFVTGFFTQYNVFEIHSRYCVCQPFIPFYC